MTTLLITGASGYLAHRLLPIACRYGDVIGLSRTGHGIGANVEHIAVDLTDTAALRAVVESVAPDAIVHAAAANPGSSASSMTAVNHLATATIAQLAADSGCRLVSVSTDVVHNGIDAPFADDAIAQPLADNVYGQTKWLGEQAVLSSGANAIIVRTSLIYGLQQMDRGTEGFVQRLEAGETLSLFSDVQRQPVWIDSLAEVLCELAVNLTAETGLINVAGSESMTRAAYGLHLLEHWGVSTDHAVQLISGAGINGLPLDLRLQLDRARSLGFLLPGVTAVLSGSC